MAIYDCLACGFSYDETKGAPKYDIPPGTSWEELGEYWMCPDCGASKSDFEKSE